MYRVVSISRNTSLLLSRNDALGVAGFTVISPRSPEQAPALAQQRQADAVIIGDSVGRQERRGLIKELRRSCPQCLVVFVYALPHTPAEPLADLNVDVSSGPVPLIHALAQRLPRTSSAERREPRAA